MLYKFQKDVIIFKKKVIVTYFQLDTLIMQSHKIHKLTQVHDSSRFVSKLLNWEENERMCNKKL